MYIQDYHLAKRYYDLAAETSTEAHVPVVLALMKLNVLYYYESYLEVRVHDCTWTHGILLKMYPILPAQAALALA